MKESVSKKWQAAAINPVSDDGGVREGRVVLFGVYVRCSQFFKKQYFGEKQ